MKKGIFSILFALVLALSVSLVTAAPAGAIGGNTWYVDPTGADDASHGTGPDADAFQTIQYAINDDRVAGGDTINVAAGTYDVATLTTVNKAVAITGPESGSAIVRGTTADDIRIFKIVTSGVTIKNLEITVATLGAYVADELDNSLVGISGSALSNVSVENNILYVPLQASPMSGWNARAITVDSSSSANTIITNNTIYNVRNGIVVRYGNTATATNNIIFNTKGGIMNYTSNQGDANNRTVTGNSWASTVSGVISHNEWDIVWNTAYYVPDYQQSVVGMSSSNNDAYVLDRRAADKTACANLTGNRSHIFVDAASSFNAAHPARGNFNEPFSSISLGVDAVVPGGTVNVAAGTYDETVTIDKSLTLEGANAGIPATGARGPESIIDAQLADYGVFIIEATTTATLDGFTVRNYEVGGILAGGFSPPEDDPLAVHILNNVVEEPSSLEDAHNNNIQVGDGTTGTIIGNEVSGALLESPDWSGSGIIVAGSSNVLVSNNYVHNCEGGIQIIGYAECRDAPAEGNIIEYNLVEDNEGGIVPQMNSIGTIIRYNDVLNNDEGIAVMAIDYSWEHSAPSGTEVHSNNIVGNTDYGVKSGVWGSHSGTVTAEEVNATNNWWGSANGPTHAGNTFNVGSQGDTVSDNVDYVPWYDTDMTGASFAPVTSEDGSFSSIQAAIDAATGTTITCAAGTYTEAVTITPGADMTIQGAGRDVTTWIAPADHASRMHCIKCGNANNTTLDISGFTFSVEDNEISISGIAILINRAETGSLYLDIHDNKFVETTTLPGETANSMLLCHNRFAARVDGVAPVKIHDNLDYTAGGVAMSNSRAFDIYDNTFDGGSDALYIGYGCPTDTTIGDHHIYNNTFRNASNTYPGGPWPSVYFAYYGPGTGMTFLPSTIDSNTFEDNDAAIGYLMDSDITYPADIIQFNNFNNNTEAMGVSGTFATTLNAKNNWWGDGSGPTHAGNPDGAGDAVSNNVDYDPWLGASVEDSKRETVTDDTVDATAEADTEVVVTGTATVTAAKYSSNPGSGFGGDTGKYVDVHIEDAALGTEIEIRLYYTNAEVAAAGVAESSLTLRWWDGNSWVVCSHSGVNTADVPPYSGYMWATINDTIPTIPSLTDLSGTPFGGGGTAGGGGGGWVGAGAIMPTVSGLADIPRLELDADGTIQTRCLLKTTDGKLTLDIAEGTKLLDSEGNPLRVLSAAFEPSPPPPPSAIILAYNLGQSGATFSPAITLTIEYDPTTLPEDVAEENLYIAYWDGSEWVALETEVDTLEHAASCQVGHFTTFALIGPITQAAPAAFSVSNLSIQPAEVQPNEAVTITLSVANTGGAEGSYSVVIKINGATEAERSITLTPGESQNVSFSVTREEAASYNVTVEELSASFTVAAPLEEAPAEAETQLNWTLIWIIVAAVVIVGLVIFFAIRRRAY